ncbi:hypothetical protein DRE_04540 [Drechslerella stenobrocha 248]|uniref:Uncharacterized protein n=1 Tax=Drechslerella stenobrocha 248 TaxID=1043628 RepID=W7I0X6_9PEZI|nr:hypothetical protein DRE_04540 [Drechslerella stenobrocha 248]
MVACKKSAASAIVLGAAAVAAQNGTWPYLPGTDYEYTTVIKSLCPTGLVDVPYTIRQHCAHGSDCAKPDIPYGWEVKTKYCETGCGDKPTYVAVTECPWETPTEYPVPMPTQPGYHKDEVVCPDKEGNIKTYTHYYPPPPCTTPSVPETTPCPSTTPYVPEKPIYTKPPGPEKPIYTKPYEPEKPVYTKPDYEKPIYTKPYEPPVHTAPPAACHGDYCPDVTKVVPPVYSKPCNTTVPPPPPHYTGAAAKVAASGIVGFAVVALAAFI